MTLTDRLDVLMTEKGINKSKLAKESGVPYTTIDGFYKKGTDNVKLSTLKRLCAYFKCSLDHLVGDEPSGDIVTIEFNSRDYTRDELDRLLEYAEFLKSIRERKS